VMSASHLCAGGRVFVLTVCMLISLNLLLSYVTVTVVIVNCCRIVYCGECICLSSLALKFSRTVVFTYTRTVHVCHACALFVVVKNILRESVTA